MDSREKKEVGSNKKKEGSLEKEVRGRWARKKPLEKALSAGIMGKPQLRREEKRRFLGEFRERVIRALTLEQVHEEGVYPEIMESINDPRADKLVVSSRADLYRAREYILLAQEHGLSFTTVDSPEHRGEIGLIVVSNSAVDEEEIMVDTPRQQLIKAGVPESLADAKGGKVCPSCYRLLTEKAPEEAKKFRPFNWWDGLTGRQCPGPH